MFSGECSDKDQSYSPHSDLPDPPPHSPHAPLPPPSSYTIYIIIIIIPPSSSPQPQPGVRFGFTSTEGALVCGDSPDEGASGWVYSTHKGAFVCRQPPKGVLAAGTAGDNRECVGFGLLNAEGAFGFVTRKKG
ncbi:hypothetical protein Tco_1023591, partial [Tanacetum coccineum]